LQLTHRLGQLYGTYPQWVGECASIWCECCSPRDPGPLHLRECIHTTLLLTIF
jgi:hypothetical protein